jgi:putative NADH-flavin reductase
MDMNNESKLRVLVAGANGGIGRQAVEQALKAGHRVRALVRNPANLPIAHPNLEIVKGDLLQPGTFESNLENIEVVISAIGVKGGMLGDKPTILYSQGNANLLEAMKNKGVGRAFFISASAIEISPVLPFFVRLVAKYVVQKLLRHMYADIRIMEKIIKESAADWTIIRPPRLTNKPETGHYRIAINSFLKNCLAISRADVAHFMIHNMGNAAVSHAIVEIAY